MGKKCIVVVIDSFGVGEMPDVPMVRPQDIGANTCEHILQQTPHLNLPTLASLGLMNVLGTCYPPMTFSDTAVYGTALLQHEGGDTFMGHQEIMGTRPLSPLSKPFTEMVEPIKAHLIELGYQVESVIKDGLSLLWVNQHIAIGDNLEADLGQVYNVTGNIRAVGFEMILAVGKAVRQIAKVGRVIAFGGELQNSQTILDAIEVKHGRYIGINSPKSGAYSSGFQVAHLGYGVDSTTQVPYALLKAGIPTVLIGKVADIVDNPNGINYMRLVDTDTIFSLTLKHINEEGSCFICSNIQETDLAGHAQDTDRYAERLRCVDGWLARVMAAMRPQDCLIVLADHGNDPTIGHSRHTREKVPLLVYQHGQKGAYLGERLTLSDVGASVCRFFAAQMPENGKAFI